MLQYQEKTIVTRVEQLSADNIRLTLQAPDIAAVARPGQFVMIRTAIGKDPLLRRPFSIHQTTATGHIQIYFRVVGRGTEILAHAKVGEELSVLGPLGHGFQLHGEAAACLIGGGLGIAPMLFLAKELARRQKDPGTDLIILGGKNAGDVEPLVDDFSQFGMHLLTTTDDGSYGQHGRVLDALKNVELAAGTQVYACGPEAMMAAVSGHCAEIGLSCQVSVESFMACGMGACLGCNRPVQKGGYAHVCIDGPVFEAKELIWNS